MKPDILCRTTRGNRQEWERQRQRLFHGAYLGGSEAAAVLGLVPRRSPSQLMAEKLGRLESEDVSGITRVQLGLELESFVAGEVSKALGLKVRRRHAIFQCSEHPFMMASIDRECVGLNAGMEVKTVSSPGIAKLYGESGGSTVPRAVKAQCEHYMEVMGWNWMIVAVLLLNPPELRHYILPEDSRFRERLISTESRFIDLFNKGELPEMDGLEGTGKMLHQLYPSCGTDMQTQAPEHQTMLKKARSFSAKARCLERRGKAIENRLKLQIGDCEGIEGICTWKTRTTESVDLARLRRELPELAEQFKSRRQSRVFRWLEASAQ